MKKLPLIFFYITLFSIITASLCAQEFFWEEAAPFTSRSGKFPVSAYSSGFSAVAWQEVSPNRNPQVAAEGDVSIYLAVKEANGAWQQRGAAAGPYHYSGAEPAITNIAIDNRGRILIAAASQISISENRGVSFTHYPIDMEAENAVAPRIFIRADGGYFLFISRGMAQSMSILYSRSDNGIDWEPFQPFTPENVLSLTFLPAHVSYGRRDIVFFQSLAMGADSLSAFQLYFKYSDDGGRTWSQARRFTTFSDSVTQAQANPNNFDNQRPHIIRNGDNLFLVWERRYLAQPPQVYAAAINSNGGMIGSAERISNADAYCQNPIAFIYNGNPKVVWFDNRSGSNRVVLAQRTDHVWQNQMLSNISMDTSFARPVVTGEGVFIFWQAAQRDAGRIYVLAPDHSVVSPRINTLNFTSGRPNRSERARVSWNIPADTSGIYGFSWLWSRDENEVPPEQLMVYNTGSASDLNAENIADSDGFWYFSIRAQDFAGNWSAPSRVTYLRKTEAPNQLTINEPETDENGFLLSNTFRMSWEPSDDSYLAGYTWNLQFLGAGANINISAPPSSIIGQSTQVSYTNQDDGFWAFTAAAIDQAGNIGQPTNIIFRTNKFIPYTNISNVDAQQDDQGILEIRITGRGFLTNGRITSIVLQYDNKQHEAESFNIVSDREIDRILFEHVDEGSYQLRVQHSTRGWYTAAPFIAASRPGTVKFGDYTRQWISSWIIEDYGKLVINPITILALLLIIFCVLGIVVIIRGISGAILENIAIKQEALAILTGDFMPMEKKQKLVKIKKRGRGLSFQLARFIIILVILIVVGISTPMYIIMTNQQKATMLQSLKDRSSVLLEGVVSSARNDLERAVGSEGQNGLVELMNLPPQKSALRDEANYITIIGYGINSIHTDHVWVTNDPDIGDKIDTSELRAGVSRLNAPYSELLKNDSEELNNLAKEKASDIAQDYKTLDQLSRSIPATTEENMSRLRELQASINYQKVRLTERLAEVTAIRSYPEFSLNSFNTEMDGIYIFYKPIMYLLVADDNFFRGFAILEVSVKTIVEELVKAQALLLKTIGYVALGAIVIGIIGAMILAALIVRPILKLVRHIEIIRDTEDKAKLAGVDIRITSKDEIAVLGSTINDMTHGLVKAALAASDLSIGKEIQKKFIPLDVDSQGNKLTTGFKKTPNLNFFGYYEGAKGVSGDYFDYRDLDGRYFAIIKCDVAGKGIPAALIMIQVATMFLNYFKQWKPNAKGMHIEEVVYQINEFIETLAFKGRFAAFTLCLFDSQTGLVRFCNAGDNIVHLYDASEGKIKTISLPSTPATGVLPNFMIESTGGYKVQTIQIDKGDILLLYTDGIEEAKRKFRNKKFEEIICNEGPVDTPHANHQSGQADEEMTPERVCDIINAVMAKGSYTLHKYHDPEASSEEETDLKFDFSTCEGRVEDVIMAMVSVEKMFRCYKPEKAGEDARVLVDKKVDEFLKNHFLQYRRYCSHTREFPDNSAYMYYTHVKEDEQYDDLTILGIKRK